MCRQKTFSKVKQDEESGRVGNKRAGGAGIGSKAGRRLRAWLQKQVVPAIERSGLEGGRAEGGGAGSQLGCHVSPALRTLSHWGTG